MKILAGRLRLLSLLALAFPLASGGLAEPFSEESWVRLELPDRVLVSRACGRHSWWDSLWSRYSAEVRELCESLETGAIGADEWLQRIDLIEKKIDSRSSCEECLAIPLPPRQPVPDNFSSYSIFLVPSILVEGDPWALRSAFDRFGEAIGERRAAIWLDPFPYVFFESIEDENARDAGNLRGPREWPHFDVLRSKDYCDRFGLDYNHGPYVVTTKKRPDLVTSNDERIVIRLDGVSASGMVKILNILEQDLRRDLEVRKRALLFEEIKQRIIGLFESDPQHFGRAGDAVFLTRE